MTMHMIRHTSRKVRIAGTVHAVHERDGDHVRTVCGVMGVAPLVAKNVRIGCEACRQAALSRAVIVDEGGTERGKRQACGRSARIRVINTPRGYPKAW